MYREVRVVQPHIAGQQQLIRSNVSDKKKQKKKEGQVKEEPYFKTQDMYTRGLHIVTFIFLLLTSTFPEFFSIVSQETKAYSIRITTHLSA